MIEHLQDKIKLIDKNLCDLPVRRKSRGENVTYVAVVRGTYGAPTRPDSAYLLYSPRTMP
jgi:hypothetical protein